MPYFPLPKKLVNNLRLSDLLSDEFLSVKRSLLLMLTASLLESQLLG